MHTRPVNRVPAKAPPAGHAAVGPARQRGMAVIAALLIVAAVTTIAAGLMYRQAAYVRSVQSGQTRVALQAALRGGLMLAERVLKEDGAADARTHFGGAWSAPIVDARLEQMRGSRPPAPMFTGQLQDEQGKINLRTLVWEGNLNVDRVGRVRRLCQLVGVPPEIADRIALRMLASQSASADEGGEPGEGQDAASGGARLPASSAPMPRSLDDLRNIEGMTDEVIARLRPHVTILPSATLINVNTASAEVLTAWFPQISEGLAKTLVGQRNSGQWFVNGPDFVNRLNLPDLAPNSIRVTVNSNWFTLAGAARLDRSVMLLHALMVRTETGTRVIWSREGA